MPVEIAHIGSTSVPGLAAKPVIDVLLGAPTLTEIESRVVDITSLDYTYRPHYKVEIPQCRYFVKDVEGVRVHLHAVERGGRLWRDHICFRDLLRTDKARRSEYEDLKRRLATLHADDKSAYTLEKDVYIRSMLSSMED